MPAIALDLPALTAAAGRVSPAILRTMLLHSESLSRECGAPLYLKLENLQRTGSFKIRGATNKIAQLASHGEPVRGVIAVSAGNHAQGVACAAAQRGIPATVIMPTSASLPKIAACKALGAKVVLYGDTLEEAAEEAARIAAKEELVPLHPYDDWDVIAGQASLGLEILEDLPRVNTVVVPLGGGGLLAGVALALKLQRPDIRVIGVQTDSVAPYRHFLQDGAVEPVPRDAHTIADGIKVKRPGVLNRQVIARHVDEIVTVDDNAIAEAIVALLERTRTIGEGAGVVGLAALMRRRVMLQPDETAVVIISGGNVDMTVVGRSIDYGLASSGRLMSLAVTIQDAPGRLVATLKTVAAHGMNVRHVEHRRGELHVPVGMTEVILQIETRDFDHQRELLAHFAEQGMAARSLIGLPD